MKYNLEYKGNLPSKTEVNLRSEKSYHSIEKI